MMAENGRGTRLVRSGLRDTYAHGASQAYLIAEYGLDARAIADAAGQLLGRRTPGLIGASESPRCDGPSSPDEDL
jgi:hypothetical protein